MCNSFYYISNSYFYCTEQFYIFDFHLIYQNENNIWTYVLLCITSFMAFANRLSVSSSQWSTVAISRLLHLMACFFWLPKIGIATIGVAWYIASWDPRRPQWDTNVLMTCDEKGYQNILDHLVHSQIIFNFLRDFISWKNWAFKTSKFKLRRQNFSWKRKFLQGQSDWLGGTRLLRPSKTSPYRLRKYWMHCLAE